MPDATGWHSSLISTLGADARGLQQSVRASGFEPEALTSSGMINCPCVCCLVIISGLTCNQFHVALQLWCCSSVLCLRMMFFPLPSWKNTGPGLALD